MVYKILVFGDLPIASEVCDFIKKQDNCELVGVVIGNDHPNNNDPFELPILQIYAQKNNIPIYALDEISERFPTGYLDLGISARFSKILRKKHLDLFQMGIINFHGGLLPEVAGLYSSVHSILLDHRLGGGTLHWVDEGIDSGLIIRRCEFQINENDTVYSVFRKTQLALLKGFIDVFPKLLSGELTYIDQNLLIEKGYKSNYFNKDSLEGLKRVDAEDIFKDPERFLKNIRAFDFPGYEPAYILVNNTKVYLRLNT